MPNTPAYANNSVVLLKDGRVAEIVSSSVAFFTRHASKVPNIPVWQYAIRVDNAIEYVYHPDIEFA